MRLFHFTNRKNKNENNDIDYFEESKPTFQEMLADKDKITRNLIDYSNYTQVSWDQLNWRSSFNCFHGILFYIFYNSEGKFNTNELEIHFSGANNSKVSQFKMLFLALNF